MGIEDFELNVECILDWSEKEERNFFDRLAAYTREINAKTFEAVNNHLAQEKEYAEKCEAIEKELLRFSSRKKEIVTSLDDIALRKKLVDKKLAITKNQHTKLLKEIEEEKGRKESIALEMVDLQAELEERKKKKNKLWNAIKRACAIYKENLNYHIDYTTHDDCDCVKVTFFKRTNPELNNYYIQLLNCNDMWKVHHIEPPLKDTHMKELNKIVDTQGTLDDLEAILCLCKVRLIFLKYYYKQ